MQELENLHAWCALWRVPRVGAKRYARILQAFGSPRAFFALPDSERQRAGVTVDSEMLDQAKRGADTDIRWLQDHDDAHILTLDNAAYPWRLKTIADPPPVLFARGKPALLAEPQLAIVGSRSPSHEGLENAKNFASYLTGQGIVITSGLAQGIDGAAHEGALAQKNGDLGETIAVMGTGPDRIYPAKHRDLAYRIAERGCIITEFPTGTPVKPQSFPRRNRVISGLSLGTLVIEAGLKSGSLITARTALEQNREVFAIPGSIHNPLARGCNHLIRNGAKLVETAKDIFEELRPELFAFVENEKSDRLISAVTPAKPPMPTRRVPNRPAGASTEPTIAPVQTAIQFDDDPEKAALWAALSHDPQPVDVLVQRSGLPANKISSMLLMMELNGQVIKQAGGRFQKKG
ncbi:MAG: DNA-protecting protein DprA [Gammaproteobacteria bacterium]|nr:MAG: DNA-protecting protein DprA [Gammaproteobacteria bacterium]